MAISIFEIKIFGLIILSLNDYNLCRYRSAGPHLAIATVDCYNFICEGVLPI